MVDGTSSARILWKVKTMGEMCETARVLNYQFELCTSGILSAAIYDFGHESPTLGMLHYLSV